MPEKNTIIEKQKEIAKEIKNIVLEEKTVNKQETQILKEIKGLEIELARIFKKEANIEKKIEEIEELEKISSPEKISQIEKKRWKQDAKRREIEKAKWLIQEKLEKVEQKIKLIELKYQELLEKKRKFGKAEQEIFQKNKDKELAQEKARLENKIFQLASKEKTIEKKHQQLLKNKNQLKAELIKISRQEKAAENIVQAVQAKEKEISDPKEKTRIEKQRWQAEDNRKLLEKSRWELEKKQKKLFAEFKKLEKKHQEILNKEKLLKEKIKEINGLLKKPFEKEPISLKKPIPEAKESPTLESRRERETLKAEQEQKRKQEEQKRKQEEQKRAQEKELVFIIKEQAQKPKKEPGFLAKLFNRLWPRKYEKYPEKVSEQRIIHEHEKIEKIKEQKYEEEQRKKTEEEMKKQYEAGLKKTQELMQEQEIQQRQELKRYRDTLVEQYEQELRKQRQELIIQHKKELEEKKNELEQKKLETEKPEQKVIQSQEIIKERYIPYAPDMPKELIKQPELIKQLEKEEQELKKQHKAELSKQAEELMRSRKKELIQQEEKIIRIQHEELKKDDLDRKKPQEKVEPEKLELTEKQKKKKREDLAIRRKAIQMEVARIEQEELRRKELQESKQEEIIRREKQGAERQKKIGMLEKQERGVIKHTWEKSGKRKLLSKQEIQAREQREKQLLPVFELAVKHYKEKKLDKAEELFIQVKEQSVEPEKEPGFLAKLLNKLPLYIKAEKYLERIQKQKIIEQKKIARIKKRQGKKQAKQKKKQEKQAFVSGKEEWKKQPFSRRISDFLRRKITFYQPIISIDISDHSIEILYLGRQRSILSYGRTIIEQGIVRDGEIIRQKDLTKALRLTVQRAGFQPFDPRKGLYLRAIVSLPEFKTYIQSFAFDSRANLFEKVKQEIEKTIPFPINDLYWSYIESRDQSSSKIKVLCAAALKDTVNDRVHFLKASGINPIVFDIEAASLGRALLSQELKQNTIILDIGARTTNLNIFDKNGFICLSAAIPCAGLDLAGKIADELGISKEKAEIIMGEKGFKTQDNPFLPILEQEARKIIKEVQQSINYYHRKFEKDTEKIKKIILAGGVSLVPEIDSFFQKHFKEIKVEMGNPLKKIKRKGGMKKDIAILYSNTIGLALRGVGKDQIKRGINLLPEEIKLK